MRLFRSLLILLPVGMTPYAAQADEPVRRSVEIPAAVEIVKLSGPYRVEITVGGAPGLVAEGDADAMAQLDVQVQGDRLDILHRDPAWTWTKPGIPATIRLTVPALSEAVLAGDGSIAVDKVARETFGASLSGNGSIDIGSIETDMASFDVGGAEQTGRITARGHTRAIVLTVEGAGRIEAGDVTSTDANVSLLGPGSVDLTARREAVINLIGPGEVRLKGGALCHSYVEGGGKAHCN